MKTEIHTKIKWKNENEKKTWLKHLFCFEPEQGVVGDAFCLQTSRKLSRLQVTAEHNQNERTVARPLQNVTEYERVDGRHQVFFCEGLLFIEIKLVLSLKKMLRERFTCLSHSSFSNPYGTSMMASEKGTVGIFSAN